MSESGSGQAAAHAWRGSGLPPSALARLEAAKQSGLTSSLLGVKDFASLEAAALDTVGSVVGCRAERIDWGEFGLGDVGCGYVPGWIAKSPTVYNTPYNRRGNTGSATSAVGALSGSRTAASLAGIGGADYALAAAALPGTVAGQVSPELALAASGIKPVIYTHAAVAPIRSALERMLREAAALGADGVVAVQLTHTRSAGEVWECTAMGTAVKARGATHLRQPFATTLSGAEVSKLLRSGYAPVSVAVGMTMGIVHDLRRAQLARNRFSAVREIGHLTELVIAARHHARSQIAKAVGEAGAGGAILSSQMTLELEEHSVAHGHDDVVATVTAVASTIVSYRPAASPSTGPRPLCVLPLRPR